MTPHLLFFPFSLQSKKKWKKNKESILYLLRQRRYSLSTFDSLIHKCIKNTYMYCYDSKIFFLENMYSILNLESNESLFEINWNYAFPGKTFILFPYKKYSFEIIKKLTNSLCRNKIHLLLLLQLFTTAFQFSCTSQTAQFV